ncbi:male-specific lethal 3 homolog [Metopolophium dirhodum]|uniref:male-specific lethal 3 homolog n=1 Tax=Metopolophium dirhodum TaxID=44670 RepID=UPI00299078C5|nr:male-specific lethal 3 homolog [Metopolophium dirhodum]
MVKHCMICGNVDGVDGVSVHRFPANVDQKRQWVMFAKDNGFSARQIFAYSKLCSRHFVAGRDYHGAAEYRRPLTVGAVPSVNSINTLPVKKVLTKCKFKKGENVLCYEPQPAKTKLLYNSKVLKVVPKKDEQGCQFYEFLIHFHGWNSKWDTYVTDKFILKDTEENRELLKELADQAQLTPDGNLYRKERKKRAVTPEPKPLVIEPALISIDDESMVKDENVPVTIDTILLPERRLPDLEFPDNLKSHIEYNCYLVREKDKLIQLPCQPNVVTILENYLRYLAKSNFSDIKATTKKHQSEVLDEKQLDKRFTLCVEVLDGLRICFNTFLFGMLLVNKDEQAQYYEALKVTLQPTVNNTISQNGEQDNIHTMYVLYLYKAYFWKAVPDSAYDEEIKQPAIVYGVYHLLRLLENLPKILANTKIDDEKLSIVYSYSNGLLKYLSTQTYLFGMQYYVKKETDDTEKSSALIRNRRNHKNI